MRCPPTTSMPGSVNCGGSTCMAFAIHGPLPAARAVEQVELELAALLGGKLVVEECRRKGIDAVTQAHDCEPSRAVRAARYFSRSIVSPASPCGFVPGDLSASGGFGSTVL